MNYVTQYLEQIVTLHKSRPAPEGWKYGSYEELILTEGTVWTDVVFDNNGPMKNCYENSLTYAMENGVAYCEGYALGAFIPVLHAWCLDGNTVIETTWKDGGPYVGIAMDPWKAGTEMVKAGYYGLLANDFTNDHTALKKGVKNLLTDHS